MSNLVSLAKALSTQREILAREIDWPEIVTTISNSTHQQVTTMQVSVREFKTHLSRYLSKAQAGEQFEITSHRKVVARVIGVSSDTGFDRLTASGAACWSGGKPKGSDLQLAAKGTTLSQMILEDRG